MNPHFRGLSRSTPAPAGTSTAAGRQNHTALPFPALFRDNLTMPCAHRNQCQRIAAMALASAAFGVATTFAIAWWLSYRAEGIDTADGLIERKQYSVIWNARSGDLVGARIDESHWLGVTYVDAFPAWPKAVPGALAPQDIMPRWAQKHLDEFAVAIPPLSKWDDPPDPEFIDYLYISAGWPWPALKCTAQPEFTTYSTPWPGGGTRWPGAGVANIIASAFAVDRGPRPSESYVLNQPTGLKVPLPYHPIWPGLLADSAFFGCAWAVPLFGVPATRRALRRRRGLCPRCAYSLCGLAPGTPCPECGRTRTA